ncbi:hypothetical protein B0A49_02417 [Cryomyces minteri]|uniref:Saccharopine dehydrogenase NADP binding domain-containing protein n=1 Tax=Cryomyces minteri TaxID=331657 RepID=A0A4U0WIZ1_9PEZI|nr:hypothetical protein B0A49_08394 [Cryomyces minteri]TKA74718.1 hypothetical protein B0A49_02417 [Cryomyces minteri]
MSSESRQYEIVVLGATGYTGKYAAEHITTHLPTDLKWALAGRSSQKLSRARDTLKSLNSDRRQPDIEVAELNKDDLNALTKKTRLLINTVGPYHLYSTPVVEACANNGTHYLDVTGESPWVLEVIQKYHETAKRNGAIIIPQIGIESAPADLIAYTLVSHIRRTLSVGIGEVIATVHALNSAPSGGTLATMFSLFEAYSPTQIAYSMKRWSMSPVAPPTNTRSSPNPSLVTKIFGVRTVPGLGVLTTSLQGGPDIPIVHRSWGLIDGGQFYGPNFRFSPYMSVRNVVVGALLHFALGVGMLALALAPLRWLLRKFVYAPGEGPTREAANNDYVEYRAIATADAPADSSDPHDPKRASARFVWNGSMYRLTGVFLAEAAITILRDRTLAHQLGGGVLTPATLGLPFVERCRSAGVLLEVRTMAESDGW